MSIHQKNGNFFFEKMMKAYFKMVMLSLKVYNGGGRERLLYTLIVFIVFLKQSLIDVKNDEGVVFLWVH